MRAEVETFNVSQVPAGVWEALLEHYKKGRELIDLIKREPDLVPLTKGFQLVTRNAKLFRKNLLEGCAKKEQYAAAIYFDWLEDQDELNDALEELEDQRDEKSPELTIEAKTIKKWLDDDVPATAIWVYMHCSADRFPEDAFALVEKGGSASKSGGAKKKSKKTAKKKKKTTKKAAAK